MRLTAGQRAILEALRDGQELDCARPGGWWLGNRQVAGPLAWSLLRACLIRGDGGKQIEHYTISQWGRQALEDPAFAPPIQEDADNAG